LAVVEAKGIYLLRPATVVLVVVAQQEPQVLELLDREVLVVLVLKHPRKMVVAEVVQAVLVQTALQVVLVRATLLVMAALDLVTL
jgi:hypothetical protein